MAPKVTVNPDSSITKGRTPVTDIITPSAVKRLQDYGYSISHADDPAAAPAPAKKGARRASKKKTAKKTAKKKGGAKSTKKAVDKLRSRMKKR